MFSINHLSGQDSHTLAIMKDKGGNAMATRVYAGLIEIHP